MEKMIEMSMLYDFYGQLLTAKQQEIWKLYHEDDYSLSEIAQAVGISRQGVHDAVKKAEKSLHEYEVKLRLVAKFLSTEQVITALDQEIDKLIAACSADEHLTKRLQSMKQTIDQMND